MQKNLKYLLIILWCAFSWQKSFSQKLTVSYNNVSLTNVLGSISQRYHVKIAFDVQLADKIMVNRKFMQTPIDAVITNVLSESGLKAQRMGDVYMVIPDVMLERSSSEVTMTNLIPTLKAKKYINGIVKDMLTGEILPFASIYTVRDQLGAISNADGFFKLEIKEEDSIFFLVNYLGYQPQTIKTKASANPPLLSIFLNTQIEQLQTTVVSSRIEVFDNRGTRPDVIKFSPSKMANIPSITELDISTPLQMLPGISGCNENAGGFSIRKAPADKTLMVYDGFTIYNMNHFFGAFSSINTKAVKDIQVYKNANEAHFGGSTAGIIEITGKTGNMQHVSVDAGADMLAADIEAEIPIVKDKCSFLFAGRRSYTDKLKTPLYNALFDNARYDYQLYYVKPPVAFSTNPNDPKYYFSDYHAKLTIKTSVKSNLSFSSFRSYDNLNFSKVVDFPKLNEKTDWGTKGASLRWAGEITTAWNTELVAGFSNTTFNYTFSDSIIKRLLRNNYLVTKNTDINLWLKNVSLQTNNQIRLTEKQVLELGLSVQSFNSYYGLGSSVWVNALNLSDTSRTYQKKANLSAFWAQYELKGDKWSFRPGVRFSRYSALNKYYPEFRASLFYKPVPRAVFKIEFGNYFQFVNKVDFVRRGDFRSAWVLSDGKKYPVTSSNSISGGLNYNITTSLNIDIEAYYNQLYNLTTSLAIYKLINNNNPKLSNLNWTYDSNVKGLDIMLRQSWKFYQVWLSYTLSQAQSVMKKGEVSTTYNANNDQLHELKLLQLFNYKNFSLSWSNLLGSGMVWDEYMLDNNLQLSPDYKPNSGKTPIYYRMDAGANYTINFGTIKLKTGFNLFNILNRKNVINRFEKLSDTPLADIRQGINPVEETTVNGLGFTYNFFIDIVF